MNLLLINPLLIENNSIDNAQDLANFAESLADTTAYYMDMSSDLEEEIGTSIKKLKSCNEYVWNGIVQGNMCYYKSVISILHTYDIFTSGHCSRRTLVCFCDTCQNLFEEPCLNVDIVGNWQLVKQKYKGSRLQPKYRSQNDQKDEQDDE